MRFPCICLVLPPAVALTVSQNLPFSWFVRYTHMSLFDQSNLCLTTNTLGTQKYWPLLTSGPYSAAMYTLKVEMGPNVQVSLVIRGRYVPLFWTANTEFPDK